MRKSNAKRTGPVEHLRFMKEKPVRAQKTEKAQGHDIYDTTYPGIESCRFNLTYSLFLVFLVLPRACVLHFKFLG